ncbi:MAG: hypothetical protein ACRDID_13055 [Ktedonobacterales bacterium]
MGIAMSRGPRTLAPLALLALLTALMGGCASAQQVAPATHTASSMRSAPPTATPSSPPPTRSFQQAWGAAPITRLATEVAQNQEDFNFLNAATPDGQWLIGEVASRALAGSTSVIPYLAAYNVHTRQIVRVHALSAPQRGVSMVATDGTWFVWQEVSNQGELADGVIRVLNWKTGAYREYPQAMLGSLAVENGRAIWSQITPNEPSASAADQTAIVRLADLNAGTAPKTLAQHATSAALAWPWAGWGVMTDTSGDGYLQFKNLATGQAIQSAPIVGQTTIQSLASSLTLHGVTAVFTMEFGGEVDEIPDVSRSAKPLAIYYNSATGMGGGLTPGLGPVSTNGRLIAWSMSSGGPIPQVFDSAERALVTLPTTSAQSYVAWTGANLLVWDDPEPAAQQQADEAAGLAPLTTLCVVDTSALPTTPPA